MSEIECPRCQQPNAVEAENCVQCYLPLNPHHLSTFAKNLLMQRRRIENKEDEILLYVELEAKLEARSE